MVKWRPTMYCSVDQYSAVLRAHAGRLIEESAAWAPDDTALPWQERQDRYARKSRLLWQMALTGGGMIYHLSVLRRLSSKPRLQTRALQLRSELCRIVDSGD